MEIGLEITEMTQDDLPAVMQMLADADLPSTPKLGWLAHCTFGDPTCYPELRLLGWQGGRLVGLVFACLRSGKGIVKWFAVRSSVRRQGVATALFDELESRLQARKVSVVSVTAEAPNYFAPGIDLARTEAVCFLLDRGYGTDRKAVVDMTVDLAAADLATDGAVGRLAEEGIVLRRARPDEVDAVAEFARAEFSLGWQQEVSEASDYAPIPLFAAFEGERVVAFAVYDVTGPSRFGPTGTRQDYRGRGIGSALLRQCLGSIKERGELFADIGWVGPISFYARAVGARISRVYWRFDKTLGPSV
jgi:ribosomal protein S18 acetylase RimI-like enzyme